MVIGAGVYYDFGQKAATTPVAVLRESAVRDFAVGESFLTHNLVKTTDTVTIRGVAYPLAPLQFFTVGATEITGRAIALNESHRILIGDEYRLYKNIEGELVSYSPGNMMEGPVYTIDKNGQPVTANTPIASLEEGFKYLIAGTSGSMGSSYTITEVIDNVKVVKELTEFKQLYNVFSGTLQWYRGGILQDLSQPVPYTFMMLKANIKLYEDDGVTHRVIPRDEVIPFLELEGGAAPKFSTAQTVNFSIVLNAQIEKRENLPYIFRERTPNGGFVWQFHPPFGNQNYQRPRAFDSCMPQRGDGVQGIVYRLMGYPSFQIATGAYVNRINWTPKADGTPFQWVKVDPSEEARLVLEAQIATNKANIAANKTAIAAKDTEIATLKTKIETLSGGGIATETDPIATAQIATLKTTVDGLGVDTLKTSVSTLTAQLKTLDDSKASQADLDALKKAQADLATALAALPKGGTGATPEQLKAVNDRVKALESAISTAENSKGILNQDVRSHFLIGGALYGGVRRLVSSDIDRLNQRAGYEAENPYRALDGIGQTGLANASNQWLTWFTKTTMRMWRIELTHINNNWAVRNFKRNGTQVLGLNDWSGTHTDVYKPKTSTGHEAFTSMQFVDDGGDTVISNLYASVTDSATPAAAPVIAGTTLQVGDRFRFQTTDGVSALFTYQGTDSASGAWWAKPVSSVSDSNIVLWTVLRPQLDALEAAVQGLESQLGEVGNTITRIETRALEEGDIDGSWHYFVQYQPLISTAIWRKWEWMGENNAALVFDRVVARTLSKTAATYDETTKLYSLTFDGLKFQFATEGQLRFQMPGADSKFTNLSWKAFAADGTEIGNGGGSVTTVDPTNPNFNTNIQANPAVAQGRAIARIRYTLTPITGAEFSFEVAV